MSRIEQLTDRYLDGSITPKEEKQLFDHLREHPEELEGFTDLILLDQALMEVVPTATSEVQTAAASPRPTVKRGLRRIPSRRRPKPKPRQPKPQPSRPKPKPSQPKKKRRLSLRWRAPSPCGPPGRKKRWPS